MKLIRSVYTIIVVGLLMGCNTEQNPSGRIIIEPVQGKMMCNAVVPGLSRQVFGLGIPETIGSREKMWLVNHPDADVMWEVDKVSGIVSTTWTDSVVISYTLRLIPAEDYIDMEMTIANLSDEAWHDVFAFNCVSPARAPDLKDPAMNRTYMSIDGKPTTLSETTRIQGHMPTVGVYLPHQHETQVPQFAEAFEATSPNRTDAAWLVTLSDANETYMATAAADASFLFNNTALGCIHAAPAFGTIAPGTQKTVLSRAYMAHGTLDDFLDRYGRDRGNLGG